MTYTTVVSPSDQLPGDGNPGDPGNGETPGVLGGYYSRGLERDSSFVIDGSIYGISTDHTNIQSNFITVN